MPDTSGGTTTPGREADAPFRVVSSERPFQGHVVGVRVDHVVDGDGREATREVVEHPGAVGGLVVDADGRIVLTEQWRQAMGRRMLEVVAGKYDVDGETPEAALRREIAEEVGMEGGRATWLTTFATTPGWSDETLDLYLVEGARPMADGTKPDGDWEEADLTTVVLDFDEAVRQAAGGAIGDSKTLVALGLYGLLRAGTWTPDAAGRPEGTPGRDRAARETGTG